MGCEESICVLPHRHVAGRVARAKRLARRRQSRQRHLVAAMCPATGGAIENQAAWRTRSGGRQAVRPACRECGMASPYRFDVSN